MSQCIYIYDIKTKVIQYILFTSQNNATTHPINHCFKKNKLALKKETTPLKKAGMRKAESDS